MKLNGTPGLAVAGILAACVTIGAQSQEPRPAAPNTKPSNTAMDRTVTIVGCIVRDTTPAAGGGSQTDPVFKVTGVQPATGSMPSGTPARGESAGRARGRGEAAEPAEPLAREYRLMAMGGVDLSEHLSHKMQLTGTITPAADASGSASRGAGSDAVRAASGNGPSANAAAARPAAPATLHVTSATMVGLSCQ